MFNKVLNLKQSLNSWLSIALVLCALTVSGNAMAIKFSSIQRQDPSGVSDQRNDEGEAIQTNDENKNGLDIAGDGNDHMRKDSLLSLHSFSFKSKKSHYNLARESAAQLDKQFYIKQAKKKESERAADTAYYDPSAGQRSTVSRSFHFNF